MRGRGPILFLLALLLLCGPGAAAPGGRLDVTYQSPDGYRIFASHYRHEGPAAGVVLLFPDPGEGRAAWSVLADSIRGRGLDVLVPELRGTGVSVFQRGIRRERSRTPMREDSETGLDAAAAMRYLRALPDGVAHPLVVIGSGEAASAVLGWRDGTAAAGWILLSPSIGGGRRPEEPTAGSSAKLLVLTSSGDIQGTESAAALLLRDREAECWIAEGTARGAELLAARADLLPDLLDWISGACNGR